MLTAPLPEEDRNPPTPNVNYGGDPKLLPYQEPCSSPYLVVFWKLISLGADRGRMTSMESRVKVKRWSVYQGCGAGGVPGRRKSHTAGRRKEAGATVSPARLSPSCQSPGPRLPALSPWQCLPWALSQPCESKGIGQA